MSVSDPIADMLTRIRNAVIGAARCRAHPGFQDESRHRPGPQGRRLHQGFRVAPEEGRPQPNLKVELSYGGRRQPILTGLQRVSKPGLRVYVQRREIPRVYGGLGIAILSTPKGIMSGQEARRHEVGGELLCYVW